MFLADGGQITLTAQSDRFTAAKWDGLLDAYDLSSIRPSDFEEIDWGPDIDRSTVDCTRTPLGVLELRSSQCRWPHPQLKNSSSSPSSARSGRENLYSSFSHAPRSASLQRREQNGRHRESSGIST